jgi:hypothetical protein
MITTALITARMTEIAQSKEDTTAMKSVSDTAHLEDDTPPFVDSLTDAPDSPVNVPEPDDNRVDHTPSEEEAPVVTAPTTLCDELPEMRGFGENDDDDDDPPPTLVSDSSSGEDSSDSEDEGGEWKVVTRRRSKRNVKKPERYQDDDRVHHTSGATPVTQHPTIPTRPESNMNGVSPLQYCSSGWSKPLHEEGDGDDPTTFRAYHISAKKALKEYGVEAYKAIMKEFEQLYAVKQAISPVHRSDLTRAETRGIIRSHLFLNPKHDAMGVFEKIKARLVGDGSMQDKNLYPDRSSPTAALESLMAVLTIAAKEGRTTAVLDIGSAYLEADMTGKSVHILVDKMLTTIMSHKYPELKDFVQLDGTIIMVLKKALYGTLIAGRLWYDKLTGILESHGFAKNPIDPCVMNKTIDGVQMTLVIFVDDILATCEIAEHLTWLISALEKEFDDVKGGISSDFSYLGMHIENIIDERTVVVSMEGYEKALMEYAGVTGVRSSPASSKLFEIGHSSRLKPHALARFHTIVAKLLYLSHRVRPDTGVAVSYLTTRVTCANKDDLAKLERVLMYIHGTLGAMITLSCDGELRVRHSIDASFAAHDDGKGQSGEVRMLGRATVAARSVKQRMVTKDSTETELVALTDLMDGSLKLNEFMEGPGHVMRVPVIEQDNMSTISIVITAGGRYRT